MNVFKDKTGAAWELEISFGAAVRLKNETPFDLDKIGEESGEALVRAIYGHPRTLADVLWVLVKDQVERAGLTRDQFEDRLTPAVIDDAADALWKSVALFIHRRRAPAVIEKMATVFERIDRAHAAAVTKATEQALSKLDGNSPQ